MKRLISSLIIISMLAAMSVNVFASEFTDSTESFSFTAVDGDIITVVTMRNDYSATADVYVNGLLSQSSVADAYSYTIDTVIYDMGSGEINEATVELQNTTNINGFTTKTTCVSLIDGEVAVPYSASLWPEIDSNEPVDNTGLTESYLGNGLCCLGRYGDLDVAPDIYGYLFRSYEATYDGETKYWSWGAGDTVAAISAYIALFGGPVSAIISMLLFGAGEVLLYNQSIELATYTFDYYYKVLIRNTQYFETTRNITYWRIDNTTEGTSKWEKKKFNYGFYSTNSEMVRIAIDRYIISQLDE